MYFPNETLSTQIFGATIKFGIGIVETLADAVKKYNITMPMLVTDKGIIKTGIIDKIIGILNSSDIKYSIFGDVHPNPTDIDVMEGVKIYNENKCDGLIAVGGGSSIDSAKAIRILAAKQGHINDYYDVSDFSKEMPALIAIPTTSGTGSEVSRGALITDTSINRKRIVRPGPPNLAIIDPQLTLSMPPYLTASTGMDALSHCVEGYVVKRFNPFAEAFAIQGIKLIAKYLRTAVINGLDIEARAYMSIASTMGALAFNKGLGVAHSLSHQLSTVADVPHGIANAIMLTHAMEFNLDYAIEKYADIALAMGIDIHGKTISESARSAISAIHQLTLDIGLPNRLRDVGVKEKTIPIMAKMAMEDHCHLLNPRPCTEDDMSYLYRKAL
ncbi:MAG: iron-containing alcohol dehydrogenase family protein [bacterium]